MMGREEPQQGKLFYTDFDLDSRIRTNHPLRRIAEQIDFNFSYEIVSRHYGKNGNVSVPPPVLLKLMLLLVLYNVRSERELMSTLPERLDWLWFLKYDIDTPIPDHSVLSKARNRWGTEIFQNFFERIVCQCVEAGLVNGSKIFMDSSLIEANASCNSIIDTKSLKRLLNKRYKELENRLEEIEPSPHGKVNNRYVSTTDPEAGIVRQGRPKLYYKTHRVVEECSEIITAVEVTSGDVNEAHLLKGLHVKHEINTGQKAETIVADSKYGTIDNYIFCHEKHVKAHMPDLKAVQDKGKKNKNKTIFSDSMFKYDSKTDTYLCPAGNTLKKKSFHADRNSIDYAASKKICSNCPLRVQCTKSKSGRTIKRHLKQEILNIMRAESNSNKAKEDIKTRQHLIERSFANAKRYGFDRARWRSEWRVSIQEFLICCVQNIRALVNRKDKPKFSFASHMKVRPSGIVRYWISLFAFNNDQLMKMQKISSTFT